MVALPAVIAYPDCNAYVAVVAVPVRSAKMAEVNVFCPAIV